MMRLPFRVVPPLLAALAVAGAVATAGEAVAAPSADTPVGEITVEAPRAVPAPSPVERAPYTGAPVIVTIVRIPVRYDDLDLARPADAARLMARVERVAHDACLALDRMLPLNPDPDCVRTATASAAEVARTLAAGAAK